MVHRMDLVATLSKTVGLSLTEVYHDIQSFILIKGTLTKQ